MLTSLDISSDGSILLIYQFNRVSSLQSKQKCYFRIVYRSVVLTKRDESDITEFETEDSIDQEFQRELYSSFVKKQEELYTFSLINHRLKHVNVRSSKLEIIRTPNQDLRDELSRFI